MVKPYLYLCRIILNLSWKPDIDRLYCPSKLLQNRNLKSMILDRFSDWENLEKSMFCVWVEHLSSLAFLQCLLHLYRYFLFLTNVTTIWLYSHFHLAWLYWVLAWLMISFFHYYRIKLSLHLLFHFLIRSS